MKKSSVLERSEAEWDPLSSLAPPQPPPAPVKSPSSPSVSQVSNDFSEDNVTEDHKAEGQYNPFKVTEFEQVDAEVPYEGDDVTIVESEEQVQQQQQQQQQQLNFSSNESDDAKSTSPPSSRDELETTQGKNDTLNHLLNLKKDDPEFIVANLEKVQFICSSESRIGVYGTLRITNFRLHFEPSEQSFNEHKQWIFQDSSLFDIPLGAIDKVSRVLKNQSFSSSNSKDSVMVYISCKDFRKLQFRFQDVHVASKIHDLIRKTAFPLTEGSKGLNMSSLNGVALDLWFAVAYGKFVNDFSGWNVYDPIDEWVRQGVFTSHDTLNESKYWRVTKINFKYQFSPTYPKLLVVPIASSDEDLPYVGAFRSRARIPALTFYHGQSGGSIWRCSQPKVGLGNKVCREDEQFWSNVRVTSNSQVARIVDCRPFKNALGNRAKGMGYEDEARYHRTTISFQNIENIHTMRASMDKLSSVIASASSSSSTSNGSSSSWYSWHSTIENTGWLNHIRAILNASITVANYCAVKGFAILVHCSDGWDRTAQVSSIPQILIDPFFRTIKGFQVLIEKDWLSFGYKFSSRTAHGAESGSEERSPCFLQFIDSVWQLTRQFPTWFEYNENFLLTILKESYSCRYGTFLCDTERERQSLKGRTISLWTLINSNLDLYRNSFYDNQNKAPLLPRATVVARQVVLWNNYYLRYSAVPSINQHAFKHIKKHKYQVSDPIEEMERALILEKEKVKMLESQILSLRSSLTSATIRKHSESED